MYIHLKVIKKKDVTKEHKENSGNNVSSTFGHDGHGTMGGMCILNAHEFLAIQLVVEKYE